MEYAKGFLMVSYYYHCEGYRMTLRGAAELEDIGE